MAIIFVFRSLCAQSNATEFSAVQFRLQPSCWQTPTRSFSALMISRLRITDGRVQVPLSLSDSRRWQNLHRGRHFFSSNSRASTPPWFDHHVYVLQRCTLSPRWSASVCLVSPHRAHSLDFFQFCQTSRHSPDLVVGFIAVRR